MPKDKICLVPRLSGIGGMVSFQHKLAAGLAARGIEVSYDLSNTSFQAVLVVGGTRQIGRLWHIKRRGIRIVQRLDGMNWLHRLGATKQSGMNSLRHFLRAEYGNFILALIRSRLAERVVYQSEFARHWWERRHGETTSPNRVIHNAVDLNIYSPSGPGEIPKGSCRILMVEGSLLGGYEQGLEVAVRLVEQLAAAHSRDSGEIVELMVVGRVNSVEQSRWQAYLDRSDIHDWLTITWTGLVEPQKIPEIDRSAHLLYSADINAACPNSVIEALACGLPVLSFNTGALPELVTEDVGRIVPYGGDPWKLDPPDVASLARAATEILKDNPCFRAAARARAQDLFGLDRMVETYLEVLLG